MSDSYQSPFSWRYGRPAMRALFSEETKRRMWRRLWLALAQAQSSAGLISAEEVADLRRHVDVVDLPAAEAIEREIGHDLMAELRVFAGQAKAGGGKLHLGATSMDVEDNVEIARMKVALSMLVASIGGLLEVFAEKIDRYADRPCMAYTHLQAAEPTTLGFRFALWAQDLLLDFEELRRVADWLPAKGLRGAVGTSASYAALLAGSDRTVDEIEADVLAAFDLRALPVSGQTYARKIDFTVLSALAGLAASCSKCAFDIRVLASSPFGELGEPFGAKQVGSSAMPFKRNPILCERIDSLARIPAANAQIAWQNAAVNLLERTLDDSANRRSIIPESFLAADEMTGLMHKVMSGLRVDERRIEQSLERFGPFAATEAVLMAAAKQGADRQQLHERLRELCMQAWEALERGRPNPMLALVRDDALLRQYLSADELVGLMRAEKHVGYAATRARAFAKSLHGLAKTGAASSVLDIQLQ